MHNSLSPSARQSRQKNFWKWLGFVVLLIALVVVVSIRYVIARAEPIMRVRVINTLSERFQGKVELAAFHVSLQEGIEVAGSGLKIFGSADPNPYEPGVQPFIEIGEFRFRTALRNLFHSPMHVDTVYVKSMVLNIPPKERRVEIKGVSSGAGKISIFVDKFVCQDTMLLINTIKPGKPPLEFAISRLNMKDIGPGLPFKFDATLVNPKPVGDIHSTGLFGPWQKDGPRDTPVQGDYSFNNADLGTLKGIGGILSSTGDYSGTLSNIVVHGVTDTPDFRIASSGQPVPLHTDFSAVVDGTSGDTYLKPVKASFLHSAFTATGSVVKLAHGKGRDIELDVVLDKSRIEDLLKLGVRTNPPVMMGPVELKTKLSLTPGEQGVADRLKLAGNFHVINAHFANQKVQEKIDALSLLSLGNHKADPEFRANVPVDLDGAFHLSDGVLSFSSLHFLIPGTQVDMAGNYSLDGKLFDFHGQARLDAKLSQLVKGWKSILLKPVDPFFSKNGAGTEVPIKITGTQSEPHFGLDFHRKKEDRANAGSINIGSNRQ